MKTCAYCGRENEEAARRCAECGTEFVDKPTVTPKPKARRRWPDLRLRYLGYVIGFMLFYFLSFGPVMYFFSKVTTTTTTVGMAQTTSINVELPGRVAIPYAPALWLYSRQPGDGIYSAYIHWWIERHEAKK